MKLALNLTCNDFKFAFRESLYWRAPCVQQIILRFGCKIFSVDNSSQFTIAFAPPIYLVLSSLSRGLQLCCAMPLLIFNQCVVEAKILRLVSRILYQPVHSIPWWMSCSGAFSAPFIPFTVLKDWLFSKPFQFLHCSIFYFSLCWH